MTPDHHRRLLAATLIRFAGASPADDTTSIREVLEDLDGRDKATPAAVAEVADLIRTATITVTWDDAKPATPELPAWLIEASDTVARDVAVMPGISLVGLAAAAYVAGIKDASAHSAARPAVACVQPPSICGHPDRAEAWPYTITAWPHPATQPAEEAQQ